MTNLPPEDEFQRERTARNRNLITEEEQERFYNSTIGIAGLSGGSSIATAIVLMGGGKHLRLADHDKLELSNMNRIVASVEDIGKQKTEIIAQKLLAMNPYQDLKLFQEGLTEENMEKFMTGLDVMIDEVDNMAIKYRIREMCKKLRIPLVSAADNGERAIIDVERYDRDPQPEFFHGRLGNISYEQLANLDRISTGRMITKLIGDENVPQRMHESLAQIGKTLTSWPQLGGTAMLNGAAVAYCVRRILNNQPIVDNRAIISLDETLNERTIE